MSAESKTKATHQLNDFKVDLSVGDFEMMTHLIRV
ncbi:hypothetical protein EDF78_1331 [Rahnella sp. BIGb0236]|nr:hypothetical protein EDF78_1331 [Rahnella sp. BIGb0236]